jgi:hypothetical protein
MPKPKSPEIVRIWVLQIDDGTLDSRLADEGCNHPDLAEKLRDDKYGRDDARVIERRALKEPDGRIFLLGDEPLIPIGTEDDIARQHALSKLTAEDKRVLGLS